MADWAARAAATEEKRVEVLSVDSRPHHGDSRWEYTEQDVKALHSLGAREDLKTGKWMYQGKVVLPYEMGRHLISWLHRLTHLSYQKMKKLLEREEEVYFFLQKNDLLKEITERCDACARVNASKIKLPPGIRTRGHRPGTHWEVDFTEIKPGKYGYKYLLVFVDTFSGWPEAFPTRHETAAVVAKKLLEEIFPRYGMPQVVGSDNGPAFISQVSRTVATLLGIDWKLHCAYRPQSSGQVENEQND